MSKVRIERILQEFNHTENMDERYVLNRCKSPMEKLHVSYLLKKANLSIFTENIYTSYLKAFNLLFDTDYTKKKNRLVVLRIYDTYEFKEYINNKFNFVKASTKDYITSLKVVKGVFKDNTIYYDKELNNITVVCSSRYNDYNLSHNIKNIILLLTVVYENSLNPRFLELYKSQAKEQDWLEYFENEFSITNINSIEEVIEKQKLTKYRDKLYEIGEEYERMMFRLNNLRKEREEVSRALANTEITAGEKSKLIKDLHSLPQIQDISMSQDGSGLVFHILTDLEVDEEYIKPQIISNNDFREFLQHIANGDIQVKIGQKITIMFANEHARDIYVDSENLISNAFKEFRIYRNPHLSYYNCFGDFKPRIYQALDNSQYYQTTLLIIRSVSQLNLTDMTVVNHFKERYYSQKSIEVYVPKYNKTMSYKSYLERIEYEKTFTESNV